MKGGLYYNDLGRYKKFYMGRIKHSHMDQIKLDKFELLKLAATGKIEFSDTVWYKLLAMCQQTVNDFNSTFPDKPLDMPSSIESLSKSPLTSKQVMEIATFIMATITFIRSFLPPSDPPGVIQVNNYEISIENQQQIRYDIDSIIELLPEPEHT